MSCSILLHNHAHSVQKPLSALAGQSQGCTVTHWAQKMLIFHLWFPLPVAARL